MPTPTRREIFSSQKPPPPTNIIPATVRFKHNRKKGLIEPLSAQEKMLCALRKCLAEMSDKSSTKVRYYIAGNKVQLLQEPTASPAKEGEGRTYRARGRCRLGVCHAEGHHTTKFVEFAISYRDTVDDRGMADVQYFEPTTIDEIERNGPIDLSALK